MAYTFKNPSTNLRLRVQPQPEVSLISEKPAPKPEEYGIRQDHWIQLQHAILEALLPHPGARTAVVDAIRQIEQRLGIGL